MFYFTISIHEVFQACLNPLLSPIRDNSAISKDNDDYEDENDGREADKG